MRTPALLLCIFAASRALAADAPDFSRDVRPILSQHCFKCHGPDDKARKGGLRLDVRESAVKEAKSGGIALVPGKPGESELITRIFSTDEDELMPPPSAKRPLTPEQKDILRRWVAAGAEYQQHWAFVKPKQTAVPGIADCGLRIADFPAGVRPEDWSENPIDAFVLKRMTKEGLKPSPPATPEILCRRIFLDLTGLPPTPEELDAFVAESIRNPQSAIRNLADRLLASPRYGERWARRWLDLARYADTNGYEKDRPRSIWPYRDWVINALNADKPFDQFTVEQIAGDMLPGATLEQRIATGFHRNTMLNEEGGIDPNEFRFHAMTDRVATTGVTWLGLTLGCAQCHTHKFDPITHREYYQLMAFMNNADEPDVDIPQPDAEEQRKKNAGLAEKLLAELPEKWATKPTVKPSETTAKKPAEKAGSPTPATSPNSAPAPQPSLDEKFAEWLARERERTVAWQPLRPASAKSNLPLLTIEGDASVFASGDISKADTYELHFRDVPAGVTAIQLEALPDPRLPAHGPGMAFYEGPKGDFFIGEFQLSADGQPVKFAGATESYSKNNFGKNPATAALMLDGDPQTGWSTAGRMGERHTAVLTLPSPAPAISSGGDWTLKLVMGRHYACSIGRFRISVTTDARPVVARDLPEEMDTLLALPEAKLTAAQRGRLREEFLMSLPELQDEAARIRSLRKRAQPPITLGFRERPPENPRPTFIHNRGEYLQPTDPVTPGIPSFLNPLGADAKRDRLTFARWLVSPENPLTARVTVNRQWAAFFGRGLVKTTEDFGYQGEAPTHPELLDWLAVEFVKQGWSLKKLHRLIVTSATYRQSSRVTPALLAADRDNRLLSRFPRVRLEAEIIRDAALAASGLLTDKVGGPSVHPPQPDGVTEAAYGGGSWTPSTGADRHRRSLYTFSKRTAPFALYNTFDGPTGEACIARRDMSNTPLQALSLLNDVVFAEAAQAFGKQLAGQKTDDGKCLTEAFRLIVCRNPSPEERTTLLRFLETQRERLAGAKPSADAAAWTALVRALFSLDEVVTKG